MFHGNLEQLIHYEFKKEEILIEALTHSSYTNEHKNKHLPNNERLEFLGDAVLSIVISEHLFNLLTDIPEGKLTRLRSKIVCESTLAKCAKNIELGSHMQFGKGEEMTGGRDRESILADAFEALIAAIYLDGGLDSAKEFIHSQMDSFVQDAIEGKIFLDYKTHFQELIQNDKYNKIHYEVVDEEGPDHCKTFYTEVYLNDDVVGHGSGRSKKEAEQDAARYALEHMATKR